MYILGLNYPGHDTAAALVKDGKLICAVEEERLSRRKHTKEFPEMAIKFCLEKEKISINDLDAIVIGIIPWRMYTDKFIFHTLRYFPKSLALAFQERHYYKPYFEAEKEVRKITGFKNKIKFINHHDAHMASSYYLSPFNHSAIMSIDGLGEYESTVCGVGEGNRIMRRYKKYFPHSIGLLYAAVTHYLGFRFNSDEGKVMGLAPYGDPSVYYEQFKDILKLKPNGNYQLNLKYFSFPFKRDRWVSDEFIRVFGPMREKDEELTQKHKDIAAALQLILEEGVIHIANHLYKLTKIENICLAGGVALNCVANGKIMKETPFKNVFVQPAAGDAGVAIGAALHYYYTDIKYGNGAPHPHLKSTYLGPEFSEEACLSAVNKRGLKYKHSEDITGDAAKLLADGKILGWFQGATEFGPRALGNRSIITAPYPAEMKDVLNSKVKHREGFRPFAPSVLYEKCAEYFDCDFESPYMLLVYNVHPQKIEKVAATAHVDGTGRVQTVTKDSNPLYYDLIRKFGEITGTPLILNTSFNVRGEPIVCTPENAINCFMSTKMDYLVLRDLLISKDENV